MESRRKASARPHVEADDGLSAPSEPIPPWEEFTGRWSFFVRSYLCWLRCAPHELDELTGDVLVDAYALLDRSGDSITEDLVRRAAQEASRQHKRLMRLGQHQVGLEAADHLAREHSAMQRHREVLWEWLDGLLGQLTPKQRAVMERHLDGVPDVTIVAEVGGTVKSVRTLRPKAIRKLRAMARSSPPPSENEW